jgi:hypothetical protein
VVWVSSNTRDATRSYAPKTKRRLDDLDGLDRKRAFKDLIPLPRRRQLVTLEDAGNYIAKLPKAEHQAPEWQDAMEALMLVAPQARIGVLRALHRNEVRRVQSQSQRHALGKAEAEAGPLAVSNLSSRVSRLPNKRVAVLPAPPTADVPERTGRP